MSATEHSDLSFIVTPRIRQACLNCLSRLPKDSPCREEVEHISRANKGSEQEHEQEHEPISLAAIKAVSKHSENIWIHQLLQGSRMYIEKPKPTPRNPELVARLDAIRRQLEEQEYKRMTANVSTNVYNVRPNASSADSFMPAVPGVRTGQASGQVSIQQEMKAVNQQITVIINILFSALGVGFAVSYASYTLTSEMGYRILLGMFAALVVVLAEVYLFAFAGTRGQKKRLNLKSKKQQ